MRLLLSEWVAAKRVPLKCKYYHAVRVEQQTPEHGQAQERRTSSAQERRTSEAQERRTSAESKERMRQAVSHVKVAATFIRSLKEAGSKYQESVEKHLKRVRKLIPQQD